MILGIFVALVAGALLGLYALPEKFTKDFLFENTWGLFFLINTLCVPIISMFILIKEPLAILRSIPTNILIQMVIASFIWGIGVTLWGKAINYIGLSLGFSIFIGTVIFIGSLIPFFVSGLPAKNVFLTILGGLIIVLLGVIFNGKAGLRRQLEENKFNRSTQATSSMLRGISIAVFGGFMATGFSYANAVGQPFIHNASQALGNPDWISAVAVMCVIYISGGIPIVLYFTYQLTSKKIWINFKTPSLKKNVLLITIMAIFNFSASIAFAYAAFLLGKQGNTVGYAIYNTVCVAVAVVSGLITNEWKNTSLNTRKYIFLGLLFMVFGIVIIAIGNAL